jgi:hypothetical protein
MRIHGAMTSLLAKIVSDLEYDVHIRVQHK